MADSDGSKAPTGTKKKRPLADTPPTDPTSAAVKALSERFDTLMRFMEASEARNSSVSSELLARTTRLEALASQQARRRTIRRSETSELKEEAAAIHSMGGAAASIDAPGPRKVRTVRRVRTHSLHLNGGTCTREPHQTNQTRGREEG